MGKVDGAHGCLQLTPRRPWMTAQASPHSLRADSQGSRGKAQVHTPTESPLTVPEAPPPHPAPRHWPCEGHGGFLRGQALGDAPQGVCSPRALLTFGPLRTPPLCPGTLAPTRERPGSSHSPWRPAGVTGSQQASARSEPLGQHSCLRIPPEQAPGNPAQPDLV